MAILVSILLGGAFTLASSYALGVFLLRKVPAPPEIALGLGAAVQSFLVLVLLLCGAGFWPVFLALGTVEIALLKWFRRTPLGELSRAPVGRTERTVAAVILGAYAVFYFVNALAPEIYADGITYHLGLPFEYARLGGFPDRIEFYGILPEGMEMLYTMALALGRHSAAKLVEFGVFAATVPLFFRIARRLGAGDRAALVAVVCYFCAPVVGLAGATSYNDAAEVFFALAAFYLLLVWRDTTDWRYLLPAGALAGFCYAIKFPGAFVVGAAVLFVLARRRILAALLVAAGASLVMIPWLARAAVLTGDPLAPMMTRLFPNPYFHVFGERILAAMLRSLKGVPVAHVPWELAFGDHLMGTFGPLLLALPLGLVALRRRSGRLCWAAATLLAIPWFANTGARFLMPSVAFAALALGMALPRPAAWAAIVIQAVVCWPHALDLWQPDWQFRLHEFPWRVALRIESDSAYLRRHIPEYEVAQMVERATPPGSRTLALQSVAKAYLDRDVRVEWQSAEGERLLDVLQAPLDSRPMYDWKATWAPQSVRALRFRLTASSGAEWDIEEVRLYSGEELLHNSPQWILRAWPNRWETPYALDGNLATRWRTWEPMRAGMYFEVDLDYPQRLTSAVLVSQTPDRDVPLELYGLGMDYKWHLLSNAPAALRRAPEDLRPEVMTAVRNAGYRFLLVPTGEGGHAPFGNLLMEERSAWRVEIAALTKRCTLFRLK